MSIILRPYQQDAVDRIRASYRSGKRAPLFVLPCGGGKSIILSYIADGVAARNKRVVVQCHRAELVGQLSAALDKVGRAHGIIAAGIKETLSDSVQIASVDTLVRRVASNPARYRFDLAITDEAHHLVRGNKWGKVIDAYPNARLLGVTASPERLSGEGLGAHAHGYCDDLIVGPSVRELTECGALVPIRVFAPPLADLSAVHVRAGEYDPKESAALLDTKSIVGDAISHYRRICNGQRAIVFAVNIAHSRHVAEQFTASGIPARHVDCETPAGERAQAMADFRAGRVLVLCNQNLFTEGVDVPGAVAVIMLRKTKSLTMFVQMVGRASRPAPGKTVGYLIDHCANVLEHDMPDADRTWSLDGRKRGTKSDGERIQRMKLCGKCFAMSPIHLTACEQCHHPFEPTREPPKQVEGELVEVTEAQREMLKRQARREVGGARTRDELLALAKARGYRSGWADFVLRARGHRRAG